MLNQIGTYFAKNSSDYWAYVWQHVSLSVQALFLVLLIALPLGYVSYKHPKMKQLATLLTQGLRVIPSLGVLFILIPLLGVGHWPALIALVILGIPPVLLNTIVGFEEVPDDLMETGFGLGMTEGQRLWRLQIPLALPHILNGIKLALVEIIASATLATYIGAGGLGNLIFTGLGLYRYDLLLIGGGSVALLSFVSMIGLDLLIKKVSPAKQKENNIGEEKMKNRKVLLGSLLAIIVLAVAGFALFNKQSLNKTAANKNTTIRMGSKDFTENLVVAEVYALALEDKGYKVDRVSNISSSLIHKSLTSNEIDLYPEYTGTGLLSILKGKMQTDPEKVYETVKKGYEDKFKVTWLDYAKANDGQGLVIRTQVAKKLGIKTISDLQKHASELRFASQGEFDQREDGIPGLTKAYGDFSWKSSKVYDNSLKYSILENNEADVTPAYTTEGQLVNTDKFTLLEDDKQFWPPYNLAPVVRDSVLKNNPDIKEILNKVSKKLDTKTVTQLNAQVDVDGKEYTDVAKTFYKSIKD